MCGLVGVICEQPKAPYAINKAFKVMLTIDQVRGAHSTGVLQVTKRKVKGQDMIDSELFKKEGTPDRLLADYNPSSSPLLLMGHNRYATQGKINEANAHPFWEGDTIGAHNGTLTTREGLTAKHKEVDSQHIIASIDKDGFLPVVKNLNGAYALTVYNEKTQKLSIARNSKRPLYLYKGNEYILYASRPWMIMAGVEAMKHKYNPKLLIQLPIHEVWEFNLTGKTPLKPTIRKYEAKTYTQAYHWNSYYPSQSYYGSNSYQSTYTPPKYILHGIHKIACKLTRASQGNLLKLCSTDLHLHGESHSQVNLEGYKVMANFQNEKKMLELLDKGPYFMVETYQAGIREDFKDIYVGRHTIEPITKEEYEKFLEKKTISQMDLALGLWFKQPAIRPLISTDLKGTGDICECCGGIILPKNHDAVVAYDKLNISKGNDLHFCSNVCLSQFVA